jgi:uncharacterized protein YlxW (UPF0749 family)
VLESFVRSVVEDDYASVPITSDSGARRGNQIDVVAALVVAVVIGLVIITALFLTRSTSGARQATQEALVARVDSATTAVANRQALVEGQRTRVDQSQAQLLAESDAAPDTESAVGRLAALAGTDSLSGRGLTISLDDAPDAGDGSLNRVLDRDLQDVVNALWQGGAQGIAVNGHRLTDATAIRSAGEAILVNYEPLTRPYAVTSVGGLESAAADSGLQRLLSILGRDFGLVSGVSEADVVLPAGELRQPRFAVPTQGSQP